MADDNEFQQIRDALTNLNSGVGEIRSTLTMFIERITRLEERSERIPHLEKRIDEVDGKFEPIRDEVIAASSAARWANNLAKWIMPAVFSAVAAIAGLYVKDNVQQQLTPVVNEMHSIQRDQQADIADLKMQLRDRTVDTRQARN
ncbi:hypothetical protein WL32_28260 [Burkholderia cepacia]|uniref:hypothetical protein n=1 Tax=Burkholderia cepacia TaxID=292 RepID=UPI0007554D5B|nr:hypothetical protein [Burkholderia cepacia]KWB16508.1 hypothetical protein WL32_28260 [Burkholderia cepacia]